MQSNFKAFPGASFGGKLSADVPLKTALSLRASGKRLGASPTIDQLVQKSQTQMLKETHGVWDACKYPRTDFQEPSGAAD